MKAFSVFWENSIVEGEYKSSAIVIAEDITSCMVMAATYGPVKSVILEKDLVIDKPKASVDELDPFKNVPITHPGSIVEAAHG